MIRMLFEIKINVSVTIDLSAGLHWKFHTKGIPASSECNTNITFLSSLSASRLNDSCKINILTINVLPKKHAEQYTITKLYQQLNVSDHQNSKLTWNIQSYIPTKQYTNFLMKGHTIKFRSLSNRCSSHLSNS